MPTERKRRFPGKRRHIGYKRPKKTKGPALQDESHPEFPELLNIHEIYESDNFFKTCLQEIDEEPAHVPEDVSEDVEHYVVLDRVYRHNPEDDLDKLRESRNLAMYGAMKETCKKDLIKHARFTCLQMSNFIRYADLYDDDISVSPVVKTCVTVDRNFVVSVVVHGRSLPVDHSIYSEIPRICSSIDQLKVILECVSEYKVCPGNNDNIYQNLLPVGAFLDIAGEHSRAGYRENVNGSTIRSTKCSFLIKTNRCGCCTTYRRTLTKAHWRQKEKVPTPEKNWIKSTKGNKRLSDSEKLSKLQQMKTYVHSLETEVDKLRRQVKKSINDNGVKLREEDSIAMFNIMKGTDNEVRQSYPIESSIQRLFWEQQITYASLSNKKRMRWHPMIIKWAILMKSKSSATYDALRRTGFIDLPSERTLYDYTNVLTRGTGFNDDVIERLKEECDKFTEHQRIVGLLQDEVRIRSDLVYDKYTGELIGFVDLDSTGNDLLNMEQSLKRQKKTIARYVLVVMVRGLSTKLKFPLAHFATNGIISDQLFSILWRATEIVEIDVGLTVLFVTSDGASPNRRFIHLHGQDGTLVYRAENVFAEEQRFIYFISDPPHLLKTARNNFSNSFSHKKTKKLWRNGKDISWMHLVDLYQDKCNALNSCYKLVPKLTKRHVDLVSFNYMKVNLAAQVMSSTVANALEMTNPIETEESVAFIRHMNKFFDIMNTRSIYEGVNKRNENLEPFTSVDDPRLDYLTDEFLRFFDDWEMQVLERPGNFTKVQRNTMLLSYQTIEGLKITVNSVVACVKFCLNAGMPFVLTERFNQDVIEQHFGVHRQSCGSNDNPSLHEFNSTMQKVRVVGGQALAPLRGNITAKRSLRLEIDNTPLQKCPRV